ncbi:unnamed protein product [Clonostachys rosea]|uniref:Uncharacterized protein n=1 Tax=Bionectria ochroleuca TaxID=29856 RepID=A0ABY6UN17_BIOOC|nr:unnamed protein product [Clonostachys rosea]
MASLTQLQYTEQRLSEELRTIDNSMQESVRRRRRFNENFWLEYEQMDRHSPEAHQAKTQFEDDLHRMIEVEVLMKKRKTTLDAEIANEGEEATLTRLGEDDFTPKGE